MSHGSSAVSGRIVHQIKQWLRSRWQECVRCSECEQPVLPFDSLCSNCGQANPAKVSVWAGIYLAAGFILAGCIAASFLYVF